MAAKPDFSSDEFQQTVRHMFRYAEVGRCVSSITHDVNNLLGAIMAYTELVGMEGNLSPESARMLNEILGAVRKSSDLINNLTDISRRDRPDVRIMDMTQLVDRTLDLRRYDLKINGIEVLAELEEDLPPTTLDLPKLERALMHMVVNAMEFLAGNPGIENKQFKATTRRTETGAEAVLWNSGPPIAGEAAKRMFEPFFTTKKGHLGLGLCIAKETARMHKGTLDYDPERGFILHIPRETGLG